MVLNAQPHFPEKVAGFPFFPNVFSSALQTIMYGVRAKDSEEGGITVIPAWHLLSPLSFSMEA